MTSQADSQGSEDEVEEDEEENLLDGIENEEHVNEDWEVAQTRKAKYAGVSSTFPEPMSADM